MTRVPSSVRHAVRDLVALLVLALIGGTALALGVVASEPLYRAATAAGLTTPFDAALSMGWSWTRDLAPWALVVWFAARARAASRTRWLPAASAVGVVLVRTLAAILPSPGAGLLGAWPGPAAPVDLTSSGSWVLTLTPAWGYPALAAAALVTSAVLGARDTQGRDDPASTHVQAVPPAGRALTAVLVGVPATVATTGAAAALLGGLVPVGGIWWVLAIEPMFTLVQAVLAAALLSGTGPSGVVAATFAALAAVVPPVSSWLAGGADLLLLQAAASLAACALAIVWRPCAAWAAGALTAPGPPPPAPTAPETTG